MYQATDKKYKNNTREISKKVKQKIKKAATTSFLFCPKNGAKKYLKYFLKKYWQWEKGMLK